MGAGVITCNYDGFGKFKTIIDEASIGSNTALVAPVKIGAGAIIGAGSTITANVPNDAIATTRSALDVGMKPPFDTAKPEMSDPDVH